MENKEIEEQAIKSEAILEQLKENAHKDLEGAELLEYAMADEDVDIINMVLNRINQGITTMTENYEKAKDDYETRLNSINETIDYLSDQADLNKDNEKNSNIINSLLSRANYERDGLEKANNGHLSTIEIFKQVKEILSFKKDEDGKLFVDEKLVPIAKLLIQG